MKKQILSLSMLAVAAALSFSSCKKDDDGGSTSRKDQLVGTWKNTQTGDDNNGNGTWDAAEVETVPASEAYTLSLAANGTGTVSATYLGAPITGTANWLLQNNDEDIRVAINVAGLIQDTMYYKFINFSSTEFTVRDTVQPYTFDKFVKQ